MILLLIGLCVILSILCYIRLVRKELARQDAYGTSIALVVLIVIGCILIIPLLTFANDIVDARALDKKIAMYTETNDQVEQDINVVVQKYCAHEKDTYTALTPENAILFATTYPELQSNTLVQQQIELYIKNNNTIRKLKEKQIDTAASRWWLYFGG